MLKLEKISKKYKTTKFELKNISLELNSNSLTFLLGKSGSGKTTLLNIIRGLDKSFEGTIEFDGVKYWNDPRFENFKRNYIGNVYQDFKLIKSLNVKDNILCESLINGVETSEEELLDICEKLKITHLLKRSVRFLSGGEKQRVAIARCLVKKAKLILCDEPTGSLDSKNAKEVFSILKEISKNATVIVVSHNSKAADTYADQIINIKDGEIQTQQINAIVTDDNPNFDFKNNVSHSKRGKFFLKMGLKTILSSPLRIALTTSLIAFLLAGFNCFSLRGNENKDIRLESIYNKDINYLNLSRIDSFSDDGGYKTEGIFTEDEAHETCKMFGLNNAYYCYSGFHSYLENYAKYSKSCHEINGIIPIDSEFINTYQAKLIYGSFPANENEIVLPLYLARQFIDNGYYHDGNYIKINHENEMVGKYIRLMSDYGKQQLLISAIIEYKYNGEFEYSSFGLNNTLLCGNNHSFETEDINLIYFPISKTISSDKKIVEKIENTEFIFESSKSTYVNSSFSIELEDFVVFNNQIEYEKEMSIISNIVEIIFLSLAVGSILYYFSYLFSEKNDEIETMRTVGFGKGDIKKTYLIYSLFNGLIVSGISLLLSSIGNSLYYLISFPSLNLNFTLRPYSQLGLIITLAMPILCNCLFTLIFGNKNISKKYK